MKGEQIMFKKKKKMKQEPISAMVPNTEEKVSTVPQNLPQSLQKIAQITATPQAEEPVECVTFKDPSFRYKKDFGLEVCARQGLHNPFVTDDDPYTLQSYSQPQPTLNDNIIANGIIRAALNDDGEESEETLSLYCANEDIANDIVNEKYNCMYNALSGKYQNNAALILAHANKIVADMVVELVGRDKLEDAGSARVANLFDSLYMPSFPCVDIDTAFYKRRYNEIEAEGAKAVQNNDQIGVAKAAANFDALTTQLYYMAINSIGNAYNSTIASVRRVLYNNPNITCAEADRIYKEIEVFATDVYNSHVPILIDNITSADDILPIAQQACYPENCHGNKRYDYYCEF